MFETAAEGKGLWVCCTMPSTHIIEFVRVHLHCLRMLLYFMQRRSVIRLYSVLICHFQVASAQEKAPKGPVLWQPCVPGFPGLSQRQMCFQSFPPTTKMFLIFQHFCIQMHLPIWFSQTSMITKHPPIVLSVIILQILQPSSWNTCVLVGSDPSLGMGGSSSGAHPPGGSAQMDTPESRAGIWFFLSLTNTGGFVMLISNVDVNDDFMGERVCF